MISCVIRSPSCSQTTMSRRQLTVLRPVLQQLLEQGGRAHCVAARLLEQVEELAFLGGEQR